MRGLITRLLILLVILGIDLGAYYAVSTAQLAPLRALQDETRQRFGTDLVQLCQSSAPGKTVNLPSSSKFVIIDTRHSAIYKDYNDALPATIQAKGSTDVSVLVCLSETTTYFATDKYGSSGSTHYTCERNRRDIQVALIDARSGAWIDGDVVEGLTPPECPDSTDSNLTRTGELPPPQDVIKWLLDRTGNGSNAA